MTGKKKIVVIGGGTGTVPVLSGLKIYADVELAVIVSMTDDGGSNAVVRDEFGILPLSDLRKSIIALSDGGDALVRELFTYRFHKGQGLSGHTLGNLMMMALTDIGGSELKAIEAMSTLFKVRGKVTPVTLSNVQLVAEYDDGERITGEHLIDEPSEKKSTHKIRRLSLSSPAVAFEGALAAIEIADAIIVGPGDLYTSTLANIIVPGIAEAIQKSSAQVIFVNNLMTKAGQTLGFGGKDMVREVSAYLGRLPDVVIHHKGVFPAAALQKYAERKEEPIKDDYGNQEKYVVVRADVAGGIEIEREVGDTLVRSLIRHDAAKLAQTLHSLWV